MSRAAGVVADAVAAVIAAQLQAHLNAEDPRITREEAHDIAQAAVAALRVDGWHITPLPVPTPNQEPHR